MVAAADASIARRKDGKYFLYLPKNLVEDTGFPFHVESSVHVRVIIDLLGERLLVVPIREKPTPKATH